jgi:hypothetical protein
MAERADTGGEPFPLELPSDVWVRVLGQLGDEANYYGEHEIADLFQAISTLVNRRAWIVALSRPLDPDNVEAFNQVGKDTEDLFTGAIRAVLAVVRLANAKIEPEQIGA